MKNIRKQWKLLLLGSVTAVLLLLGGCKTADEAECIRELEYTVLAKENIPTELLEELEARKSKLFQVTYEDGAYLYLCVGYGEQESGGYCIQTRELALYEEYILLDTVLMGPTQEEAAQKVSSAPYLVIRTEALDYPVVFR
ncbi:MAG: protease complex subunit PrcB family protein [Lachnospiraceae bacterium]|nr:protease complex subunit PrcB family protein [Lachnospiraceae bacterium]